MKKLSTFLSFLLISLFVISCGSNVSPSNVSSSNSYDEYSLNLEVKELRNKSTADIDSIVLDVNGSSTNYVLELEFIKSGLDWLIDLPVLPIDELLTFTVRALNTNSTIYSATKDVVLNSGENNISLELQEEFAESSDIPTIQSATTFKNDDNSTGISFQIFNYQLTELSYSIYSGSSTFTPDSGLISSFNSSNHLGFLDVNYTAPSSDGTYSDNTIELINANGDRFITSFDVIVNNTTDDVSIVLNMPPNIGALDINNTDGDRAIFTANATDEEGDALSYNWVINNGNPTIEGDTTSSSLVLIMDTKVDPLGLKLTVTDSRGSSSTIQYFMNY